ncbi:MAG: putative maltokinase [Cyanophyceae cyanobacterium]
MKSTTQSPSPLPTLRIKNRWQEIFEAELREQLVSTLRDTLYTRRWFGGKARNIRSAQIVELIPIPYRDAQAMMVWLQVEYAEGDRETYVLLLGYAPGSAADLQSQMPAVVAQVRSGADAGVLFEATADRDFLVFPLEAIAHSRRFSGQDGQLVASQTELFPPLSGGTTELEPRLIKGEQSNTSIIYGDRLILKFFRKIEPGLNPDLEIGRFLSEHGYLEHFASIAGALEYQRPQAEPTTVASLQQFVPNNQDAWKYTLDCLQKFLQAEEEVSVPSESLLALSSAGVPESVVNTIGSYLEDAKLLGQRTAELHRALASDSGNPSFAPEPFTLEHQHSVYQNLQALAKQNFGLLKQRLATLSPENQQLARAVSDRQSELLSRFESVTEQEISALRTRCHGDYHLGQVLYTGDDFIIIDFEGEPARPLAERRLKLSPLRDVAGMLQSFNYAANMGLRIVEPQNPQMKQRAQFWFSWVSAAFLDAYLNTAGDSFLPKTQAELQNLLDLYLFEKATYELGYELNNRPDWVDIPLQRLLQL